MYYILCIDLLYVLTLFHLIMYDYVYTVCVCLSVLCLEYIVIFVPGGCILKCVYSEEVNVKMCKVPIHSSTPRGEVSRWMLPRVVAHLSSLASCWPCAWRLFLACSVPRRVCMSKVSQLPV